MGSRTGTWFLLGLLACVASLASAANIQHSDGQTILENNGQTFLSNGAGQIIRGHDGKTILIGSDGRQIVTDADSSDDDSQFDDDSIGGIFASNNNNNVIINGGSPGKSIIYGDGSHGSYINSNGRSLRIVNGAIELNENGQVYTFQPKAPGVNQRETVNINGQPAQVEYSNGDIVVELADHTVVAKLGNRTFIGDRQSFDNRDKLVAEAHNYADRIQQDVRNNLKKTMDNLKVQLGNLGNIFN